MMPTSSPAGSSARSRSRPTTEYPAGRPVATWKFGRDGVELSPFGRLDEGHRKAFGRDGQALLRFLGRA